MKTDNVKVKSYEAFNRMASTYDESLSGKYTVKLHGHVLNQLNLSDYKFVLDLGCGTGQLLSRISRPDVLLAGIDIAPEMLVISRQKLWL